MLAPPPPAKLSTMISSKRLAASRAADRENGLTLRMCSYSCVAGVAGVDPRPVLGQVGDALADLGHGATPEAAVAAGLGLGLLLAGLGLAGAGKERGRSGLCVMDSFGLP
jgi:hypothetical protein